MAENVDVRLRLIGARKFRSDAQGAGRSVGDIGDRSGRAAGQTDKLDKSSRRTRRGLMLLGTGAKYAGFALGGFTVVAGKKSIAAASNLEEQIAKTGTVFGQSGGEVHKWSKGLSLSFALSQRQALEAAGTFGNMLVPMGISRREAAGMSKRFTTLGSDMASFNNKSPEESLQALSSGLAGESEPLRRFGVNIRDAALNEFLLSKGINKTTKDMTGAQKSRVVYQKILADTKDQQGDMARTGTSWANVQRKLAAVTEDLGAKVGAKLLPHLRKGGLAAARFIDEMEKGKGTGGRFATTMKGIWEGVRPVAEWLGRAAKRVARFAGEHLNLVKFAVALGGIKLAASKLGGGLFSRAGARGGGGFVAGFKGGLGSFFGAKFGEFMLSRYGGRFTAAGRATGAKMGQAAGPAAATSTAQGITTSSRSGKLAGAFRGAGLALGVVMGAAIAIELGKSIKQAAEDSYTEPSKQKDLFGNQQLPGAPGTDSAGNAVKGLLGKFGLAKGGLIAPGMARGGMVGVPRGEDTLRGLQFGEFVMRKEAVRDIGLGRLRAMNAGRDNVTSPSASMPQGATNATLPDLNLYIDGELVQATVERRTGRQKARR